MRSSLPRVAVVMATYNGVKYLEEQIRSILSQDNVRTFIFFRDDGSTDGTLELLRGLCERSPDRMALVTDSHGNQRSPGKNFLLGVAAVDLEAFDYLALSDQDDLWLPGKIEAAVGRLSSQGAEGYSSDLTVWDGRREIKHLKKGGPQTEYDHLFQSASAGCTYVLTRRAAQAVARKAVPLIPRLDQLTAHDLLIYAAVRSSGMRWVHDDRSFILYRQHGSNTYGTGSSSARLMRRLRLIRNNWYGTIVQDAILVAQVRERCVDDMLSGSLRRRLRSLLALGKTRRELPARALLAFLIVSGILRQRRATSPLGSGVWQ